MGPSFCRLPGRACCDVREGLLRNWRPGLLHGSLCAVAWLAQWSAKASGGRSPWRRGNHERGVWATGGSWVYRTSRYDFGDKILARKSHSIKKEDFSSTFCCFSFQKGDIEQAIHLTKRLTILGKSNRSLRASALAYPGFQRFLALGELGAKSRAAGDWARGGAASPPVPRRPWFRPQLSESEKPLEPRVALALLCNETRIVLYVRENYNISWSVY